MKTNGKMASSGSPCIRQECRGTWADYVAKWIASYKAKGLPVWAVSVQNEPTVNAAWEACVLSPQEEADFLGEHLGPTLRKQHPEVLIFVYDDSKHLLPQYVDAILGHPKAADFVHGAAFHWYTGDLFENVAAVHEKFPNLTLLPSEATYERRMWDPHMTEAYADWRFGEGYAHDIIGDLNAGAAGWIDWNMLLEVSGGPNHVGNVCDAAVVADVAAQLLHRHPQYYFVGHFSKYISPGSRRLGVVVRREGNATTGSNNAALVTSSYGTCTGANGLEATSFRRPDRQIVAVVLNCGDNAIKFKLRLGDTAVETHVPAHAIQTYLFPP